MLLVDGSPFLTARPTGVARALAGLLGGLSATADAPVIRVALPDVVELKPALATWPKAWRLPTRGATPREIRAGLTAQAEAIGARVLLAPWSATTYGGPPTVVWMHEWPDARWGSIEGRMRRMRQRRHRRRAVAHAVKVVVPSEQTRADLVTLAPTLGPRIVLIPNAFDAAPWRASACSADEPPYALVVGTGAGAAGARKKGIDLVPGLRRALKGTLDVRVVGGTAGYISEAVLRDAIARARVLIHPARSEGFGYPVLEAAAAGVPVVTTTHVPTGRAVGARCVPPGDLAALVQAVRDTLAESAPRTPLAAHAAAPFEPETVASAWCALLRDVGGAS